jgi:transposase InsO family protein
VYKMCRWLSVSTSGYYEWRDRPASASQLRRERLAAQVLAVFNASDGTYGYRRVHAELARRGIFCGDELVRALMAEQGLVACQPRPFRVTTVAGDEQPPVPDLVGRDFTAEQPGTKLVGDITYVKTWAGWVYLATVVDCASKMVVGWSIDNHMRTSLVTAALDMAKGRIPIVEGCIFHSDRGTQYMSAEYRKHVRELGMRSSVGRTGVCWDNAMAESFFGALKNELVHRTAFPTEQHARRAIANYIEVFYNRRRIHSGLGYRTPAEVMEELLATPQVA